MSGTDLQTVLHRFLGDYRQAHPLSPRQAEVCRHIGHCRTEALGGVQLHCDQCDYAQPWYCACRDRHCPKCQWRATAASWGPSGNWRRSVWTAADPGSEVTGRPDVPDRHCKAPYGQLRPVKLKKAESAKLGKRSNHTVLPEVNPAS